MVFLGKDYFFCVWFWSIWRFRDGREGSVYGFGVEVGEFDSFVDRVL